MAIKSYDLSGLKFLVVDNSDYMRKIVVSILKAFHVSQVMEASDGAEALVVANTFRPDVIIVDWLMEPIDGLEMTRIMRRDKSFFDPFVPIILLTGRTEMRDVEAARDAGVTEFCAKPISAWTLYSHIGSCIEHPREFVRTTSYVGPDRKRKIIPNYAGPERRHKAT